VTALFQGPRSLPNPNLDHGFGTGAYDTSPLFEKTPIQDAFPGPAQAASIAPFALATPHQVPANVFAAMNPGFVSHRRKLPGEHATLQELDVGGGTSYWGDITVGLGDMF
jgi:hypothetical protein